MDNKNEIQNNRKKSKNYLIFTNIVFQMVATILTFTFFGRLIDSKVEKIDFPLFTLIGSLLGIFISLYLVIKAVLKLSKNEKEN